MNLIKSLIITFILFIITVTPVIAQQQSMEMMEATILKLRQQKTEEVYGQNRTIKEFELKVTQGSYTGEHIVVNQDSTPGDTPQYAVGDKVVIVKQIQPDGSEDFIITDFIRRDSLLFLLILFVLMVVMVAKGRGLASLLGLVVSFAIIFKFILPQISNGVDPIVVAILASAVIIPTTFYLSHGFNKKTHIAIAGTLFSLLVTGILATIFVNAAKISGFSSEEAGFLSISKGGGFNFKGLVLAGIIIGTLGILDDVTVSQSAIVIKLKETAGKISIPKLYNQAISIGYDHIASMVNTLILVYTGAALPLLIMFIDSEQPFLQKINYEILAEEIVRTLVSSIGLILAVPVTTFLACIVVTASQQSAQMPAKTQLIKSKKKPPHK